MFSMLFLTKTFDLIKHYGDLNNFEAITLRDYLI